MGAASEPPTNIIRTHTSPVVGFQSHDPGDFFFDTSHISTLRGQVGNEEDKRICTFEDGADIKSCFRRPWYTQEKDLSEKALVGLKPIHVVLLVAAQTVIIIIVQLSVVHESFPKLPAPPPYPAPGQPGGPIFTQPVPVIPFKRYPPGFDVNGPEADGTLTSELQQRVLQREFKYQIEIINYVYLGFGMQYAFLRKFGYSTIAFGLLAASVASQWGFYWMQLIDRLHCRWLMNKYCSDSECVTDPDCLISFTADQITGTFSQIQLRQACVCNTYRNFQNNNTEITERPNHARNALLVTGRLDFENTIVINSPAIMEALYATVPVQISVGVLLGKVSPAQLSIMSMLCVTSYGVNNWVCIYMLGCYDNIGGCCIIHLFGACFGIGATIFASQKGSANNPDNQPRYNADVMAMIGTILNWMTFPSFNAYFAPSVSQQGVVINTYLSLFSSSVWVMVFSSLYSGQFKLDPADVQRSSLAGGVAISSVVSIFAKPQEALIIGAVGGFVCSTAHHFLRPFMEKRLFITDTVGAVSLHALPGLVAWIAGIIVVAPLDQDYRGPESGTSFITSQTKTLPYGGEYSQTFMHSEGTGDTALFQAFMAPVTVCIGTSTGLVTGYVLRKIQGPTVAKTFTDSMYFEVPQDFLATEEQDDDGVAV